MAAWRRSRRILGEQGSIRGQLFGKLSVFRRVDAIGSCAPNCPARTTPGDGSSVCRLVNPSRHSGDHDHSRTGQLFSEKTGNLTAIWRRFSRAYNRNGLRRGDASAHEEPQGWIGDCTQQGWELFVGRDEPPPPRKSRPVQDRRSLGPGQLAGCHEKRAWCLSLSKHDPEVGAGGYRRHLPSDPRTTASQQHAETKETIFHVLHRMHVNPHIRSGVSDRAVLTRPSDQNWYGYTRSMDFRVLGSFGGDSPECRMTSFLIDGCVAVDAGAITRALTIDEQRRVRYVLITHTHMDHTNTLPFLVENSFGSSDEPVSIFCTKRVLAGVRRHLFNNDTWPDFTRIPNHLYPSVRFEEIEIECPFTISPLPSGELEVVAIEVNHIVPTTGLLLRQGSSSILFTSDTGPTERIWDIANATEDLVAVITEVSFPNHMQDVADVSLHMTPQTLAAELSKLRREVPVYLYHFKPPYVEALRAELAATDLPHHVEELEQDRSYRF